MLHIKIQRPLAHFELSIDVQCRYQATAIYGPSGAGKTSLLNMIAGLMQPTSGHIALDEKIFFSSEHHINLSPEQRGIGYVFQQDLLFPHLSIEQNLHYGYDLLPTAKRRLQPKQIIELLDIGPLLKRHPTNLSGGERQRVALGRALLASPHLLLMDEPLASLDQGLKSRIIPYLRYIRRELEIPILYVSHSVAEILELTGQVIVLDKGNVLAHGDFFKIASQDNVLPLVEEHGFENVLPVEVTGSDKNKGITHVRCGEQEIKIPHCDLDTGRRIFIGIRADDIILSLHQPTGLSVRNALQGTVQEIAEVAGKQLVYIDVGKRLAAKTTGEAIDELGLKVGDSVYCLVKSHSIRIGPEVD